MDTYNTFNEILVKLFKDIMDIEGKAIITEEFKDISNNDMHIIEAVGRDGQRNMSSIAKDMSVTVGTLTIAMNSLVKKGYVQRVRSEVDRRVVLISLTEKGVKAFDHHKRFHDEMIDALLRDVDPSQTEILVHALSNLCSFFKNYGKEDNPS